MVIAVADSMKPPIFSAAPLCISFLALDRFELRRQLQHELLGVRMIAHTIPHGLHQFQHCPPRLAHQLVSGLRLLFVKVQHFVAEDIIGQLGLDLT